MGKQTQHAWRVTYTVARRVVILVVGVLVVLTGLVMLVTPGPAIVVVPLGLGILAIEFAWARYLLKKLRGGAIGAVRVIGGDKAAEKVRKMTRVKGVTSDSGPADETAEP